MNKEELIKQFDEKLQQLRDEFISKLEDDKKEFKLTYPENDEIVYCIDSADGEICDTPYFSNNKDDIKLFEHGLYFNTKKEAEQHLKECELLFKIQQWTEIHNEGWEPNWSNWREDKYYIYYNFNSRELETSSTIISDNFKKLPYFKSIEIAKECIDTFGDEIIEVLC